MQWDKLKKMQIQQTIAQKEAAEFSTAPPDVQNGLDAILPSPDVEVRERFMRYAEACHFCNRLRDALEEKLAAEAKLLDRTILELEADAREGDGMEALEDIAEGASRLRDIADALFQLLEDGDPSLYTECLEKIKSAHELLTQAHEELETLDQELQS